MRYLLTLVAVTLITAGCGSPTAPLPPRELHLRLLINGSISNRPIAGEAVLLIAAPGLKTRIPRRTTTNDEGIAEWIVSPGGPYTLVARGHHLTNAVTADVQWLLSLPE